MQVEGGADSMRCGIDIIQIKRIERAVERGGQRFLERVFTPAELSICQNSIQRLAGRFAAKEAVSKALGTGFWSEGVSLHDLEVLSSESGEPELHLYGAALKRYKEMKVYDIALSISHEKDYAVSICVLNTAAANPVAEAESMNNEKS
ncbi:MAG: holo-ACP synthase [Eubacteriales bacterium]|nr:holo-ACP synthase [Eubacteriales bacterium]MDD4323348.1 holo-ACP synthase [Eubacteriales bacterium]MDD4540934.1 holo-ACP synthase [Eubacteriales bacterium]